LFINGSVAYFFEPPEIIDTMSDDFDEKPFGYNHKPCYLPTDLEQNRAYLRLRGLAAESGETPRPNELMEGAFIPLGWGGERIFAYLLLPANEARDCAWAELRIQNLSTDKTLYSKEFELCSPSPTSSGEDRLTLLRRLEKLHQPAIGKELARFGIGPRQRPQMREFPIPAAAGPVEYLLETCRGSAPDFSRDDLFVTRWKLHLVLNRNRKDSQSKTVCSEKHREFTGIYDIRVLGYFLSPRSTRTAILIARLIRGWEGPPSVIGFQVVGASLKKGWK